MNKNIIAYLIKKGYTSSQAAERLGVSRKLVTRWAKRCKLRFPYRKGTPSVLTKSTVKILLKKGYSNKDIAKLFSIDRQTVQTFRKRKDIYFKKEIPYYSKKVLIEDYEKSLIIGTVLGDGYITKEGSLVVTHSLAQEQYCKWKGSKLNAKFKTNISRLDKRTNKVYHSCYFRTKRTRFLKKLREELYKNDKQITKDSLKYYTALSLAIHYMDDGTKTNHSYRIATNSFTKKSLHIFNKHCKENFGIFFTIHKENKLYLPIKFKKIFENLIKAYIHPELKYKLHRL